MTFYEIATIALIPLFLFTIFAGINERRTFKKYARPEFTAEAGLTGAQAARLVLQRANVSNVLIKPCRGKLTDHYDPRDNTVYLSENVFAERSIAAIGVAAHEAGHAVQYASNYTAVKLRSTMVPVVNFSSRASMIFIIAALILESAAFSDVMLIIGIGFYAVYVLFTVITLPVELNASKRAKISLSESGVLNQDESVIASRVLRAAAMTYFASMAFALLQLLRFVGMFMRRR
jgi:Zn-dependent membrane protease YugP